MDKFTSEIIETAYNKFKDAGLAVDLGINMEQDFINIIVWRGNNPRNGWWPVKKSHIDGHVVVHLDERYVHVTIEDAIKLIKKLNRK